MGLHRGSSGVAGLQREAEQFLDARHQRRVGVRLEHHHLVSLYEIEFDREIGRDRHANLLAPIVMGLALGRQRDPHILLGIGPTPQQGKGMKRKTAC